MGADLICYLVKGPKDLKLTDNERRERIVRQCSTFTNAVRAALEQVLLDPDPSAAELRVDHPLTAGVWGNEGHCYITIPLGEDELPSAFGGRTREELRGAVDYERLLEETAEAFGLAPESIAGVEGIEEHLTELELVWNGGARDVESRLDPDDPSQQILVAGELSWGDLPEGQGFQVMRAAEACGLLAVLQIR